MSDEHELFGKETAKAVQAIAKTADGALDIAKSAGPFFNRVLGNPLADFVGITVGDPLRAIRAISWDWYARRVEEILTKRGAKKPLGAPPRLAIEILEAAQDETRDEMRELWAKLIANAMDSATVGSVLIEFVGILKQLNPLDALVLKRLSSVADFITPHSFAQGQHLDTNESALSFLYLSDLKCLDQRPDGAFYYKLSPRGRSMVKAFSS